MATEKQFNLTTKAQRHEEKTLCLGGFVVNFETVDMDATLINCNHFRANWQTQ
jgi:hypothetical protein